jgi:TonB family protein
MTSGTASGFQLGDSAERGKYPQSDLCALKPCRASATTVMKTTQSMTPDPGPDSLSKSGGSSLDNRFSTRLLLQRGARIHEFISNIRDLLTLRTPQFAGAASSGRTVWLKDENLSRSQVASFALHGGLALLLIFLTFSPNIPRSPKVGDGPDRIFAPPLAELHRLFAPQIAAPGSEGGSGGERSRIPATAGQMPRFTNQEQLVAPSVHTNQNAIMLIPPTVVGPDQYRVPNSDLNNWGLPDAKFLTGSDGPGCCAGIGNHNGTGVGPGEGPGGGPGEGTSGCCGNGTGGMGIAIRAPECAYCPRPEYSDEARLNKYQGSVVLNVTVLANGKPGNIEVLKGVGMGLDEKAIEAVRTWHFKPAIGRDGKPVAAIVPIEVVFQLF